MLDVVQKRQQLGRGIAGRQRWQARPAPPRPNSATPATPTFIGFGNSYDTPTLAVSLGLRRRKIQANAAAVAASSPASGRQRATVQAHLIEVT